MRSILSLGLAAVAASSVSADTTIAVLEFGPGGSVHRTTSSSTESNTGAVASFWNSLHRSKSSSQHAGMSVTRDLFKSADAGIVIGIKTGGDSLKSMPTAMSLMEADSRDVVGHVHVAGQASAELMMRATKKGEEVGSISKEDVGRRLQKSAELASRGSVTMETLSLAVGNDKSAAIEADEQLGRMLKTLKKEASANGKTVVVHLVVEEEGHRRLDEEDQDGEQNQNNQNSNYGEKTMYQIQTFNLYLWTSVGLLVLLSMVISAFIAMPLMPDTLLFGDMAKLGGSD